MIAFAVHHLVGTLVMGDLKGITNQDAGRVQNLRLREWRRTHLLQALRDKAEQAGIVVRLVDERGTSSTVPPAGGGSPSPRAGGSAVPIALSRGTGIWSVPTTSPRRLAADLRARTCLCSSSTVGPASPARRDRRRHLHDQRRRRSAWPQATHRAILRPLGVARHASPTWRMARIKQRCPAGQTLPERALVDGAAEEQPDAHDRERRQGGGQDQDRDPGWDVGPGGLRAARMPSLT